MYSYLVLNRSFVHRRRNKKSGFFLCWKVFVIFRIYCFPYTSFQETVNSLSSQARRIENNCREKPNARARAAVFLHIDEHGIYFRITRNPIYLYNSATLTQRQAGYRLYTGRCFLLLTSLTASGIRDACNTQARRRRLCENPNTRTWSHR